jgi:prolyl-tRNA editing enzyme YbaK/EbsC (Cys-tRNA(Pro) deacylase)
MRSNETESEAADRVRGFAAVRRSLDRQGVDYKVASHERPGSALAEHRVVKTIALWTDGQLRVVALPASERLDMTRVRQVLKDSGARLATETELSQELPDLDADALSPFGPPAPALSLVDRRVLSYNWVLASGGDNRSSLRVSPLEIVRLSHARVVDIAEAL